MCHAPHSSLSAVRLCQPAGICLLRAVRHAVHHGTLDGRSIAPYVHTRSPGRENPYLQNRPGRRAQAGHCPPPGWLVLESTSVSYGKATPYLPLIDLLKCYAHLEERDDRRAIRAKVTG
jgi:hypothetical protein